MPLRPSVPSLFPPRPPSTGLCSFWPEYSSKIVEIENHLQLASGQPQIWPLSASFPSHQVPTVWALVCFYLFELHPLSWQGSWVGEPWILTSLEPPRVPFSALRST